MQRYELLDLIDASQSFSDTVLFHAIVKPLSEHALSNLVSNLE